MSTAGTGLLGLGLLSLLASPWRALPAVALFLTMGGFLLWMGLRALWRCLEVVQLRVEGRSLIVRDGPFSWRRRPPLNGALVRRLRLIREPIPWVDQGRHPFSPDTMYTLIVELRDDSEQVLARGFQERVEPMWLALELHRALDLATGVRVELQA